MNRTWNKVRAFGLIIAGVLGLLLSGVSISPVLGYILATVLFMCGIVIYFRHVYR